MTLAPHSDGLGVAGTLDAMRAAGAGIWQWQFAGRKMILSPQAAELMGTQSLELAGGHFFALIHPDDRSAMEKALQERLASGQACDQEFRNTSGKWRRLRGGAEPGAELASGILLDGFAHSADQLAANRLAAIVASSDDAIVGKTLDGIVVAWNRGAEAIYGYSADEMTGKPLTMLLLPGQENEEREILERIRKGERVDHFETRRRRKDGEIIDVSVTTSPVWNGNGELVGASKVARDITDAKRARQALEEREAHLQSVLDTVPDAMIVIDVRGVMQSFSATAERLFGYTAVEAVGRNVSILMPEPYAAQHDGYLARYATTGERRIIGLGRLVVGRRKDGTTFPWSLRLAR